ncbi:cilia- and flagella-associated protein 410-like [Drosophila obscura]|uniref:cilia- and flagella-associated protein 410-like n=1 Tax=Drosophila obscura TaxID=7282 RepID=UPI001BB1682A|nr:cilia- and flagella-associated protein 410-like [Drosophila obscura]
MTVLLEQMVLYLAKVHDVERVVNISFVNCGLTDVSIVQRMAKLEIASLSVNGITSLKVFAGCTMLKKLYLRSNKIEDINEVEHIRNLLHLEDFTLEGNPCVKRAGPGYRGILLRTLRTLKIIDTTQVTGEEVRNALWNSNPPVMHDEHNEESLNPFDAYHQSAQQMSCSASPQVEQLVQVSPRPRRPFTAGQQEQELSPDPPGTPSMGAALRLTLALAETSPVRTTVKWAQQTRRPARPCSLCATTDARRWTLAETS